MLALLALSLMPASGELEAYLSRPEDVFRWEISRKLERRTELKLVSQKWQGHIWRHDVVVIYPERPSGEGALLVITGDRVDSADIPWAQRMADLTGRPVATVFNVPNQPLFDKREDDLIAYTFEQQLRTGKTDWPLLFPMTKSAIQAMNALEAALEMDTFVVTGASKRGWTTWLVGASADRRVKGLAPMVFDNLNFSKQLQHMKSSWGYHSEMIEDYTSKGLDQVMATPEGKRLESMVDPFAYLQRIRLPVLIVNGANDRYWNSDATSLYWEDLKMPKALLNVPNVGHAAMRSDLAQHSLAAFTRGVLEGTPPVSPKAEWEGNSVKVSVLRATAWVAESDTLDFRNSRWSETQVNGAHTFKPGTKNLAVFVAYEMGTGAQKYTLTTPVKILKKSQ